MASNNIHRLLVELAPHSVQLALVKAGRLEGFRECPADAAAIAAALAEIAPGIPATNAEALLVPPAGYVLRANAEEAAATRTAKSLIAHAEAASHGLEAPLKVAAFDSATGKPVETVGSAPWVLVATSAAQLDASKAQLAALGLPAGSLRLALPVRIGAVVTALQDMPESTRVLVWQVGETYGRLACVSAAGCEAAGGAGVGFVQIFEAVQAGLGLKFRAAASKLFFNDGYDFSETAGSIAERLAALLRPAIAAVGCKPTALHVEGLPPGQTWLAEAVAAALDTKLFSPDMPAFCAQCGLTGPAAGASLPVSALGLLFQASAEAADERAWQPRWLDEVPTSAPVAKTVAAVASAPVAPAPVAPAPAPKIMKAPAPAAKPVSPPAASAAAVPAPASAPAPAPAPAAVPTPAAAKVTKAAPVVLKPAASVKQGTAVAVAPAPEAPAPVAPAPQPKPVAAPAPVVVEAKVTAPAAVILPAEPVPVVEAPVEVTPALEEAAIYAPAKAPKKKPVALFAGLAAVVVIGGAAVFFMGKGKAGGETTAAAPQLSQEEQRLREEENARMLAEELKTPRSFRNERYSFEVSDRGILRKVVGTGNKVLIDELGWLELQGTFTGSAKTFQAGSMGDSTFKPVINKTVRDGKVVFEITGTHPRFAMETLVTCLPKSVRVETTFKPINMEDPRGPIAGVYNVVMNRQSLSLGQKAAIEPGSISFSTQTGPAAFRFNGDVWGAPGEAGKQTVVVGSNLAFFYFAGGTDPKNNVLRYELALP